MAPERTSFEPRHKETPQHKEMPNSPKRRLRKSNRCMWYPSVLTLPPPRPAFASVHSFPHERGGFGFANLLTTVTLSDNAFWTETSCLLGVVVAHVVALLLLLSCLGLQFNYWSHNPTLVTILIDVYNPAPWLHRRIDGRLRSGAPPPLVSGNVETSYGDSDDVARIRSHSRAHAARSRSVALGRARSRSVALGRARSRSVALGRARSRSVAPIPRKCLVVFGQDEDSPLALALPVLVPRRWP